MTPRLRAASKPSAIAAPALHAIYTHRRFLDGSTNKPLRCKVTRIALGVAYYRAYYGLHDDGTEWLGAPYYVEMSKFWDSFKHPETSHYFWCELHKKAHMQGDDKRECLLVGPFSKEQEATAWGGGSEP